MSLDAILEYEEIHGYKRTKLAIREEQLIRAQRAEFAAPGGLLKFVKHFWHVLEPDKTFQEGWALDAMALHLEAVEAGRITRLLINIPPGAMKSLLTCVFFPVWVWACKKRPGFRFLTMSYAATLPERDNRRSLSLLNSPEFKRLYGKDFSLTKAGEELIENSRTGFKQAAGIHGAITGRRADVCILDDPNNVADIESDVIRDNAAITFREAMSNRLNDLKKSAIIVIQQRSHEGDVSGTILDDEMPYVHLCIPALYEPERHCQTFVDDKMFWEDPREEEGECFWSERYPLDAISEEMAKGPFYWAGQFQQSPEPRGGGILKREYWMPWESKKYPICHFVLASLDPAFTDKEQNDYSGLTIWGAFHTEEGFPAALLLHADQLRLRLCGSEPKPSRGESYADWKLRTREQWGLVESVHDACRRFGVDCLLVEKKGSGHDVITAMDKLLKPTGYAVQEYDPKRLDKSARMIRVQPEFSGGQVYAPFDDGDPKKFAALVIDECAKGTTGSHDDLLDSTTAAIYYLRATGMLERREEQHLRQEEAMKDYRQKPALYRI